MGAAIARADLTNYALHGIILISSAMLEGSDAMWWFYINAGQPWGLTKTQVGRLVKQYNLRCKNVGTRTAVYGPEWVQLMRKLGKQPADAVYARNIAALPAIFFGA